MHRQASAHPYTPSTSSAASSSSRRFPQRSRQERSRRLFRYSLPRCFPHRSADSVYSAAPSAWRLPPLPRLRATRRSAAALPLAPLSLVRHQPFAPLGALLPPRGQHLHVLLHPRGHRDVHCQCGGRDQCGQEREGRRRDQGRGQGRGRRARDAESRGRVGLHEAICAWQLAADTVERTTYASPRARFARRNDAQKWIERRDTHAVRVCTGRTAKSERAGDCE